MSRASPLAVEVAGFSVAPLVGEDMSTALVSERDELLVALTYARASRLSAFIDGKSSHTIDAFIDELLDRLLEVDARCAPVAG